MYFIKIKSQWTLNPRQFTGDHKKYTNLRKALTNSLEAVRSTWAAAANGVIVPPGCRRIRIREYAEAMHRNNAIKYPKGGDYFIGAVVSRFKYTLDIEHGYAAFDLKPFLLHGPKAKRDKKGRPYVIVPFRHATPQTSASSGAFSSQMSKAIYGLARKLPYRGGVSTKALHDLDSSAGTSYAEPGESWTGYQHQAAQYANLTRMGTTGQTNYYTFRTVSQASDPASWWNPGQPPNPIMRGVMLRLKGQIEAALLTAMQADIATMLS